ncbi:MAG: 2-oxoacid:acceptor oxidoreductase subunit alpha [Patescibacteria group bacterium]|nr:2-oxoacid:acceptor oxidoreductase subunit alpha [Patescibacteria group bacterium]
MIEHNHNSIFTIVIGGAAGDGIREAGNNLGQILAKIGYEVFISFKYPSLIRGGHNYARISFSNEKVFYDNSHIDALIALTDETVLRHLPKLSKNAVIFTENYEKEKIERQNVTLVNLPFSDFIKNTKAPVIARSSAALGAMCYLLDLPLNEMLNILHKVFQEKSLESNITLAKLGYEHLEKINFRHWKEIKRDKINTKELVDGNTALARGLIAAGLKFYIAYPMTPSTSILHFLAKKQKDFNIKVIQPENEIAVINMALGIAYTGERVAIGTATGGFALMQEAFSLAGISEIPIVIAVSQRQGPATGVPTHSSQTDLRFVLHAGHGEFPRIVMAPGDPEEAFQCGAYALNLAWQYQLPVVVLLDKHVSENLTTGILNADSIKIERGKPLEKIDNHYSRYLFTEGGVSPIVFPGTPNASVKSNSYEHDEDGIATEDLDIIKKMQNKRFKKGESILKEIEKYETVKVYGDQKSKNAIIFWGSTKTVVLEANKYLNKKAKLIQVLWMEPFDVKRISAAFNGVKNIISIESNHNAQFTGLLREKTGIEANEKILAYDSRPFEPIELAEELNKLLK